MGYVEPRTYIPNNRSRPPAMTRMERDLQGSPHQEDPLGTNGEGEKMLKRITGRIPHVCVVGAGVAGLRCADILLHHGAQVTIFEGRDRIGGRLCQSSVLGHMVDLGPNWIHGTEHNPILDLSRQTDTLSITWDGRQSVFDHQGNPLGEEEAAECTELVWSIIEQAMKLSNEECANIPVDKSLFDFFREQVEKMFPPDKNNEDEAKRKKQAILDMSEMWGAFVGTEIQRQSLKYFWMEECIDGENLFVAETYFKILNKIAEPVMKAADVKFGHKVTKFVSKEATNDSKVTVELEGKEDFTFDEVVVTTPLGWLKRNTDAFAPELPARLAHAIESIGYGHLDKVYVRFPTAFWDESPSQSPNSMPSISQDKTIPNVTATTAPIRQTSYDSEQKPSHYHYPGFSHWTSPRYAPDTNPNHLNQEAVNLAALPGSSAHPTLLFYTFGPTSLHIAHLLSSNPKSTHHNLLTNFFKPYFSRLPNYSASNPEHEPTAVLATAWANDELAGYGSYANFQVGLHNGAEDVEVMRKGMPERGVWLAGEHTAPFVALGTVTGAYWAGENVARRIARAYGLEKDERVVEKNLAESVDTGKC